MKVPATGASPGQTRHRVETLVHGARFRSSRTSEGYPFVSSGACSTGQRDRVERKGMRRKGGDKPMRPRDEDRSEIEGSIIETRDFESDQKNIPDCPVLKFCLPGTDWIQKRFYSTNTSTRSRDHGDRIAGSGGSKPQMMVDPLRTEVDETTGSGSLTTGWSLCPLVVCALIETGVLISPWQNDVVEPDLASKFSLIRWILFQKLPLRSGFWGIFPRFSTDNYPIFRVCTRSAVFDLIKYF